MTWLRQREPAKALPDPPHVDQPELMARLADLQRQGPPAFTAAMAYLQAQAPAGQLDRWGELLPLSAFDQEKLDNLVALLLDPYERGRALLTAGMLAPAEVDALSAVFPEIYRALVDRALQEMLTFPPPYSAWAETSLGVLFQRPAPELYGESHMPDMSKPAAKAGGDVDGIETPTPSDRREIPVREMRS